MLPKKPPILKGSDFLDLPQTPTQSPLSPTFKSLNIGLNLCNIKRGSTVFNLFNENSVHVATRFENTFSESKTPTNFKPKGSINFENQAKQRLFTTQKKRVTTGGNSSQQMLRNVKYNSSTGTTPQVQAP